MMGHIVVLISACAVSVVLGMLLMALCNASGNAERDAEWREWETKYQAHVVKLQKRILELETLLADDVTGATDVFAKPPDEQIHQDLLDADIAWNERYALDQAASLEA